MRKVAYTPPVYIGQNLYIKPNYIVSIPEFSTEYKSRSLSFLQNEANLLNNDALGVLSRKAAKGIRNSINWLCSAALSKRVYVKSTKKTFSFKVNFITLTLPDTMAAIGSSELQKKLLNPFLVYMRKMHALKNYVWRLEFQANGKLHVHITCDTFIHYSVIRSSWNRLLKKHGFMDEFFAKHGHADPNSTDVHATKSIKNLAGYLAKYMSKKGSDYKLSKKKKKSVLKAPLSKPWYTQRLNFWNSKYNPRPITGRLWGCNYELGLANKCALHVPADQAREVLEPLMQKNIEFKDILSYPKKDEFFEFRPDHPMYAPRKIGEIFFIKDFDWLHNLCGQIKAKFIEMKALIVNPARHYTIQELNYL